MEDVAVGVAWRKAVRSIGACVQARDGFIDRHGHFQPGVVSGAGRESSRPWPARTGPRPAVVSGPDRHRPGEADGSALAVEAARTPAGRVGPAGRPVPARPDEWLAANKDVAAVALRTELFDPIRKQDERPEGFLAGRSVIVRANVRKVRAAGGQTVREFTIPLPVRKSPSELDLTVFQARLQGLLNRHVNRGHRLPRSGEQLHVWVVLVKAAENPEGIEVTVTDSGEPGRADQTHLDVKHSDGLLLHELLHYVGLSDTSHEPETIFRHRENARAVHTDGLMTRVDEKALEAGLLPRDLARIEDVSDSGPRIPEPARPEADPTARTAASVGHDTVSVDPLDLLPPTAKQLITPDDAALTHLPAQAPDWWGTGQLPPTDPDSARDRYYDLEPSVAEHLYRPEPPADLDDVEIFREGVDAVRKWYEKYEYEQFEYVLAGLQEGKIEAAGVSDSDIREFIKNDSSILVAYPELEAYLNRDHTRQEDQNLPYVGPSAAWVTKKDDLGTPGRPVRVNIKHDPSIPKNMLERIIASVRLAISHVYSAGIELHDFEILIPKYHRTLRLSIANSHGEGRNHRSLNVGKIEDRFSGNVAQAVPSHAKIIMTVHLLGGGAFGRQPFYVDGRIDSVNEQLEDPMIGAIVHELGHLVHYRQNPRHYVSLLGAVAKDRSLPNLLGNVSNYSMVGKRLDEFVAEFFTAAVYGVPIRADVRDKLVRLYRDFGGPARRWARREFLGAPLDGPKKKFLVNLVNENFRRRRKSFVITEQDVASAHTSLPPYVTHLTLKARVPHIAAIIEQRRIEQAAQPGSPSPLHGPVKDAVRRGSGGGFVRRLLTPFQALGGAQAPSDGRLPGLFQISGDDVAGASVEVRGDPVAPRARPTAGVPITALHDFIGEMVRETRLFWPVHHAYGAQGFADEVAAMFGGLPPSARARIGDFSRAYYDFAAVRGFMSLVYTQLAAKIDEVLSRHAELPLVISHVPLADIGAALPDAVTDFLKRHASVIRELFQRKYAARNYEQLRDARLLDTKAGLLNLAWRTRNGREYTIGGYLDNALMPTGSAEFVSHDAVFGDGQAAEMSGDALVMLEAPYYGELFDGSPLRTVEAAKLAYDRLVRTHVDDARVLRDLRAGTGIAVAFSKNRRDPDERQVRTIAGFAQRVGEMVSRRYLVTGTAVVVHVEAGGDSLNAGARAVNVRRILEAHMKPILGEHRIPAGAVEFATSVLAADERTAFPHPELVGPERVSPEDYRRLVLVWTNPSAAGPSHRPSLTADVHRLIQRTHGGLLPIGDTALVQMAYDRVPEWLRTDGRLVPSIAEILTTGRIAEMNGGGAVATAEGPDSRVSPQADAEGAGIPLYGSFVTVVPHGRDDVVDGKPGELWHEVTRPRGAGAAVTFRVSSTGQVETEDGALLRPDGWVRHGADFLHVDRGDVLRTERGVIERVDGWDILRRAVGYWRQKDAYTARADQSGMYLTETDAGMGGRVWAFRLPLHGGSTDEARGAALQAWAARRRGPAVRPPRDLFPPLIAASREAPGAVYADLARRVGLPAEGRPVAMRVDLVRVEEEIYRLVVPWAVASIQADLAVAPRAHREVAQGNLKRYQRYEVILPDLPVPARSLSHETSAIINEVNRVHALRPDNRADEPATPPPAVSLLSLDPLIVARGVARELGADVRLDVVRPGGTGRRYWIGADGHTYAYGTGRLDDLAVSAENAAKSWILPPSAYAEARAFGLDGSALGRLYLRSWRDRRTIEQTVTAGAPLWRERLTRIGRAEDFREHDRAADAARAEMIALTEEHQRAYTDAARTRVRIDELSRRLADLNAERDRLDGHGGDPSRAARLSTDISNVRNDRERLLQRLAAIDESAVADRLAAAHRKLRAAEARAAPLADLVARGHPEQVRTGHGRGEARERAARLIGFPPTADFTEADARALAGLERLATWPGRGVDAGIAELAARVGVSRADLLPIGRLASEVYGPAFTAENLADLRDTADHDPASSIGVGSRAALSLTPPAWAELGIKWTKSSYSGSDADGRPMPPEEQTCVSVAVVTYSATTPAFSRRGF